MDTFCDTCILAPNPGSLIDSILFYFNVDSYQQTDPASLTLKLASWTKDQRHAGVP